MKIPHMKISKFPETPQKNPHEFINILETEIRTEKATSYWKKDTVNIFTAT